MSVLYSMSVCLEEEEEEGGVRLAKVWHRLAYGSYPLYLVLLR